ncbi:MAG: DUF4830 domain-containing protein [Clostridia bacterium]|nr:DUF4830 domain-containing protein [Clostridia bacterium]
MFVYSVRASALRFVSVIVISVIALAALVVFVPTYVPTSLLLGEDKIIYDNIGSSEARRAFLAGFGWEIDEAAAEEEAVVIPARFDAVYEDYNAIQKAQGLNLERYRGKTVMRYTYPVENYPDYDGTVYATLLVYKDRVIGGDVCSAALDGFAHGWKQP